MRGAPSSPRRFSAFPASPARGGSTKTTSGVARAVAQLLEHLPDVAGEERGVADPVQLRVLDRARDRLLRDLDPPDRQRVAAPARARSCRCRSRGRRRSRRRSARRSRASSYSRSAMRVFVCRKAFGRRRKRRPPSSSSIASSPQSSSRRQVRHLGRRVVDRPVDRAHLRDRCQHLDQPLAVEPLALVRDELHQRLARVDAFAHDEMPEVALAGPLVERRQPLLPRPVAHGVADAVADVGRQPAALDLEHLVPAPRAVQPERRPVLGRARTSTPSCCGNGRSPRRRRSARAAARRSRRCASASRRPTPASPRAAPRRRDPGSGSRRTPDSADTERRPAPGPGSTPRS